MFRFDLPDPPEIEEQPFAIQCPSCGQFHALQDFHPDPDHDLKLICHNCQATVTPSSWIVWHSDDVGDALLDTFPDEILEIDSTEDSLIVHYECPEGITCLNIQDKKYRRLALPQ